MAPDRALRTECVLRHVDLRRLERIPTVDVVAAHFERRMVGFIEFEHKVYTRRQLDDGVPVLLSRLDHIYAKVPPTDFDMLSVLVSTAGDLMRRQAPSDHVAVSVRISCRRRRHEALRHPLDTHICRSAAFAEEVASLLPHALSEPSSFDRLSAVKSIFRCAAARARVPSSRPIGHFLAPSRRVPPSVRFARRSVEIRGAWRELCVRRPLSLLWCRRIWPRCRTPSVCLNSHRITSSSRVRLRPRRSPNRLRQRCKGGRAPPLCHCSGLALEPAQVVHKHLGAGQLAESPHAAGGKLERHWGVVFAAREVQQEDVDHFLAYSVTAPVDFDWSVDAATLTASIRLATDSKPGPMASHTPLGGHALRQWRRRSLRR